MENTIALTKKLHVLFVDDERLIREMVSDMLSGTVGHISLASNGQEGLDFYFNSLRPIDIVISDQTMPIMNGLDMLEKIKKHNPLQKCIMITAHSEAKYMLKAIEVGVEHFIVKPIIFDRLDDILYDLAFKIEQNAILKEREKVSQHRMVQHAFNVSLESLVSNIPLPSLILDEHDLITTSNAEVNSIFVGTQHYKMYIEKKLNFKDVISKESLMHIEQMICDWKEEFLLMGEDFSFEIDGCFYKPKIKRILSDNNTRFYLLCLIETLS